LQKIRKKLYYLNSGLPTFIKFMTIRFRIPDHIPIRHTMIPAKIRALVPESAKEKSRFSEAPG